MSVLKGDYIGFSYNGKHSSDLGIIRTSDGSRFNENLLPSMQDKTVQVPGGDGSYFFGSQYTARQFSVPFAFDSLTEKQLQDLKRVFGDKKLHPLIFDEIPYKVYQAKVTSSASIKYIAFEEGETNRIYKGEGYIQFTAYSPYAKVNHKLLDQYSEEEQLFSNEWNGAAQLLETQGSFDKLVGNQIALYNPGDMESDFILTINFVNGKIPASKLSLGNTDDAKSQLAFKEITAQGADTFLRINTKTNLFEGFDKDGRKTGNVYNRAIIAGSFFKIPMTTDLDSPVCLILENSNNIVANLSEMPLEYDYVYF